MTAMWEFLTFQRMASGALLQLVFWAGVGGCLFGAYTLYKLENWAWPFPLLLGPILVRVVCERAIIAFRSYDRLVAIEGALMARPEGAAR